MAHQTNPWEGFTIPIMDRLTHVNAPIARGKKVLCKMFQIFYKQNCQNSIPHESI